MFLHIQRDYGSESTSILYYGRIQIIARDEAHADKY